MPAQQRRRRHDESMPAPVRKQPSKRRDQGTIGRPQLRTLMLASHDRKLMPQQHEFDVFSVFVPSTPNEQPQNSREGKVSEGEEHRPILPGRPKAVRAGDSCALQRFLVLACARTTKALRRAKPRPNRHSGGDPLRLSGHVTTLPDLYEPRIRVLTPFTPQGPNNPTRTQGVCCGALTLAKRDEARAFTSGRSRSGTARVRGAGAGSARTACSTSGLRQPRRGSPRR
jgi:hypothetical protein